MHALELVDFSINDLSSELAYKTHTYRVFQNVNVFSQECYISESCTPSKYFISYVIM